MCAGATEILAVYFEDPCARPGFMGLAVRKGLWPYMQKYVAALRERCSLDGPSNNNCEVCPHL
jgi:hypothetical protein